MSRKHAIFGPALAGISAEGKQAQEMRITMGKARGPVMEQATAKKPLRFIERGLLLLCLALPLGSSGPWAAEPSGSLSSGVAALAEAESLRRELAGEIASLESELSASAAALEMARQENERLASRLTALEREIAAQQAIIAGENQRLARLQEELAAARAQAQTLSEAAEEGGAVTDQATLVNNINLIFQRLLEEAAALAQQAAEYLEPYLGLLPVSFQNQYTLAGGVLLLAVLLGGILMLWISRIREERALRERAMRNRRNWEDMGEFQGSTADEGVIGPARRAEAASGNEGMASAKQGEAKAHESVSSRHGEKKTALEAGKAIAGSEPSAIEAAAASPGEAAPMRREAASGKEARSAPSGGLDPGSQEARGTAAGEAGREAAVMKEETQADPEESANGQQEPASKLDLAVGYHAMGHIRKAREMLAAVIAKGSAREVAEARKLIWQWGLDQA